MAKILVIDDSDDLRHFLSILLIMNHYESETASDILQAEEKIKSYRPDLILLDVWLGPQNGREFCKEIKKNPLFRPIPVILLSANPKLLDDFAECEANDVIEKPFDIKVLLSKIEKHISPT